MLIVTQVGWIVNLDRMERIFIEGECEDPKTRCRIAALGGSRKYVTLGWYGNQEQAEAVMREITHEYICAGRRVYQMPQE